MSSASSAKRAAMAAIRCDLGLEWGLLACEDAPPEDDLAPEPKSLAAETSPSERVREELGVSPSCARTSPETALCSEQPPANAQCLAHRPCSQSVATRVEVHEVMLHCARGPGVAAREARCLPLLQGTAGGDRARCFPLLRAGGGEDRARCFPLFRAGVVVGRLSVSSSSEVDGLVGGVSPSTIRSLQNR